MAVKNSNEDSGMSFQRGAEGGPRNVAFATSIVAAQEGRRRRRTGHQTSVGRVKSARDRAIKFAVHLPREPGRPGARRAPRRDKRAEKSSRSAFRATSPNVRRGGRTNEDGRMARERTKGPGFPILRSGKAPITIPFIPASKLFPASPRTNLNHHPPRDPWECLEVHALAWIIRRTMGEGHGDDPRPGIVKTAPEAR